MKQSDCKGCAHDKRVKGNGCGILTKRTEAGRPCWARMTPEELQKAEQDIQANSDKYIKKGE
jgi:hypothetical protein